jgi:hypothetical protein
LSRAARSCHAPYAITSATSSTSPSADRLDGGLDDIFELQDQVASSVVGAIEPRLRLSEIEPATRKRTENLGAYDLYLRALAQWHKFTEEGVGEAMTLLKRALAIDPSYAPAAAMIAYCRIGQRSFGRGGVSGAEMTEAAQLAAQAIETGKDDPDAVDGCPRRVVYCSRAWQGRQRPRPRLNAQPQFGRCLNDKRMGVIPAQSSGAGDRGVLPRHAA